MKKSFVVLVLVLCAAMLCTTAMAKSYSFDFQLDSGGPMGVGRVNVDTSSAHEKADSEGRAYITVKSRKMGSDDEVILYVVPSSGSTRMTETLTVKTSTPSLGTKKTRDYIESYSAGKSYRLRAEAITLWEDAAIGGLWTP